MILAPVEISCRETWHAIGNAQGAWYAALAVQAHPNATETTREHARGLASDAASELRTLWGAA